MKDPTSCLNCSRPECRKSNYLFREEEHQLISQAIFAGETRHLTARNIHDSLEKQRGNISLETISDTLSWLTRRGELKQLPKIGGQSVYDTNTDAHAHLYDERTGEIWDLSLEFSKVIGKHLAEAIGDAEDLELIVYRKSWSVAPGSVQRKCHSGPAPEEPRPMASVERSGER